MSKSRTSAALVGGLCLALALVAVPGRAADQVASSPKAKSPTKFSPASYDGGDGLSRETAIILKARSLFPGVPSEYAWIQYHYPSAKPIRQLLTPWENGKRFDVVIIHTADAREVWLWFDISEMSK